MAKLTRETLSSLREKEQRTIRARDSAQGDIHLTIGMGTSGIAAGAKETLQALMEELEKHPQLNVAVRQTGGLGLEYAEPTISVRAPNMPEIIYGKVTPDVARTIVQQHLVGKKLVDEHVYDRPAGDIVNMGSATMSHAQNEEA